MINHNSSIIKIISILTFFIPFALLTGSFIPDLLISIVALVFLYLSIRLKLWSYYKNIYSLIFFFSCIYLIIRSILSDLPIESLRSSLFYFRFGLFSLAVWYIIDNNPSFIKYFGYMLLFVFIVSIVDGYYQYFVDQYYNIFHFKSPGTRMSLLLNDKMVLGNYLSRLFPLLIACYLFTYGYKKSFIILSAILLIFVDVLIYISGERTAFGLLLISTTYIIFLISKYKILRLITFIISLIIIISITFFAEDIRERNVNLTLDQLNLNQEESISEPVIFSDQHHSHIIGAINMFKDNPIFGKGPNLFKFLCGEEKYNYNELTCSSHPHHVYVQLLAETGLIFSSVIITLFITVIYYSLKHLYLNFKTGSRVFTDYQICLISCILISIWPFLPSLDFFNNWNSILYYLPVGFYLHSVYNTSRHNN